MKVIKAEKLIQGDTICVVSPASPSLTREYADRGKEFLRRQGYHVVEGAHAGDRHLLFAGRPEARAEDINRAFADRSVKAIMCSRGGAGTLDILPHIDYGLVRKNPKILVGYSDITALQIALFNRTGLISFYGPMVASDMGKQFPEYSRENLSRLLTTTEGEIELRNPRRMEITTLYPGTCEGRLAGGCLSIVVASLGTPYEIDTKDKILFFEDTDEQPHQVDRYLSQLMLAGKLKTARGIIFGTFRKSAYKSTDSYSRFGVTMPDMVKERIVPLKIPSIYGLQFGHVPGKLTIPFGAMALLDATKGRVAVEPAVT